MIFCGKKLSIFCGLMSVWGILQLTLMGVMLYSHSVAMAEDLEIRFEPGMSLNHFFTTAWSKYENAAHNCWIAVCFYIITLAVSLHQYYLNRKLQYGF